MAAWRAFSKFPVEFELQGPLQAAAEHDVMRKDAPEAALRPVRSAPQVSWASRLGEGGEDRFRAWG